MTDSAPPPQPARDPAAAPPVPRPGQGSARRCRQLWVGIAIGAFVPLLSFLPLIRDLNSLNLAVARNLWAAVAFVAVLLLFPERTRRYGVGMLIGFCALLICGAGTCIVVVLALEGG
jgi:multidrug transporter EmrE-like cation transporter